MSKSVGVDEPLSVVTLAPLKVVDWPMTSPAPIEVPVKLEGIYGNDSV
jgi:hypothetical protein